MDDNYQTYLNRIARMTLPEAYRAQTQYIQESSKFQMQAGNTQAVSFPGYTVITPPYEEDSINSAFYTNLQSYQEELLQLPLNQDFIVPVPPASFHLTLADLIWNGAYQDACQKNPDFEQQLRSCFAELFQQYQDSIIPQEHLICWQVLGLIIMPRAVGVCLIPKDEASYEQVSKIRRTIYQNPKIIALGIEQHYHFTAHITLGYFTEISAQLDRDRLAVLCSQINQQWIQNELLLQIHRVELRKFDDMTHYYRQPDWPSITFSQ